MIYVFAIGQLRYTKEQWIDVSRYLDFYKQASKGTVGHPEAYYMLARAYEEMGNESDAIINYQHYIDNLCIDADMHQWAHAISQLEMLTSQ